MIKQANIQLEDMGSYETEILKKKTSIKKLQSINDKVTISNLNRDIETGRLIPSKADWKMKP
jgi:hypothetical protein